jgi:hypothetical protein
MNSINKLRMLGLSNLTSTTSLLSRSSRIIMPRVASAVTASHSFSLYHNPTSYSTTSTTKDTLNSWACFGKGRSLVKTEFPLTQFGDDSIDMDIICCGICGTDIPCIDSGWKLTNYPGKPSYT